MKNVKLKMKNDNEKLKKKRFFLFRF